MLSYKEFIIARLALKGDINAKSVLASTKHKVFKNELEINKLINKLKDQNLLTKQKLKSELNKFKVKNAIILAAGGADINDKSSYSMPKGLYVKDNECLIQRQIEQLKNAGINDITLVLGYKQEMYFYLQEKYGVKLVINPEFRKKNNIYSLFVVANKLSNTYICNCDNYFLQNPFNQYEYKAFHTAVMKKNAKNELFAYTNENNKILNVCSDNPNLPCLYGFAYFDKEFSKKIKNLLSKHIDNFRVYTMFYEEFIAKHAEQLNMYLHLYESSFILEFDSIQEIQNISTLFLDNISTNINKIICEVLECTKNEINAISILQKGLTNILFTFNVKGQKYIFRYPGDSSEFFIYRKNELKAQLLATKAKVDNTCIYIDEAGIKISKFRQNCENLNKIYYKDINFMKNLARKIRAFHDASKDDLDLNQYEYNPLEQTERLITQASKTKGDLNKIFAKECKQINELFAYTQKDNITKVMCHNDINADNCLYKRAEFFDIIDFEFAGYNDRAYDFGRVIAGYLPDSEQIDEILSAYYGRKITYIERLHFIAYVAIHNYYYCGWALYKESINESSRDWLIFFYEKVKMALNYALPRYKELYG